jgi:chromosome segregation ATPase
MKKEKSELEKELVYKPIYLPVRFFKKEAYIHIDDYKEAINKRENAVNGLEEENKKLKSDLAFERTMLDNVRAEYKSLQNVIKKLDEKVRFLEECLDRKEKLNEKYRKEIEKLKSTYVYDAKQVRDIC